MTTRDHASYKRVTKRLKPKVISIVLLCGLLLSAIIFMSRVFRPASYRQAIVIVGNPIHIVSFSRDRSKATVITMPEDTVIPAVLGYGQYSLASLSALDSIEGLHGKLLTSSISDAVGVPVLWYVRPTIPESPSEPLDILRQVFSWNSIFSVLRKSTDTSLSGSGWMSFVLAVQSLSSDAVSSVNINSAIVSMPAPDGVDIQVLDIQKLDFILEQSLMDRDLRGEGMTISVYNSTDIPAVGQRVSRLLSHIGLQLVFVGNSDIPRDTCIVSGTTTALRSKTAVFIREYFRCRNASSQESSVGKESGADLIVELGTDYARQFQVTK